MDVAGDAVGKHAAKPTWTSLSRSASGAKTLRASGGESGMGNSGGHTERAHLGRQTNSHGGGSGCSPSVLMGRQVHTGSRGDNHPTGPGRGGATQSLPQRRGQPKEGRRPKAAQRTLADFFPALPRTERIEQIGEEFTRDNQERIAERKDSERKERGRTQPGKAKMQAEERSHGCVTQNVNGFGATAEHRDEWMRTFKHSDRHGRFDIVCLQETHVGAADIDFMTTLHARGWGFRVGPQSPTLSLWSPAVDTKGGVAVMVDPYGLVKELKPALKEHWSPHFMAVTGVLEGHQMLYLCVYAPHQHGHREAFFRELQRVELPRSDRILMGGDFNCTLDPQADRSHVVQRSTHDSEGLRTLLSAWGLMDAVDPPGHGDARTLSLFHARTHTYNYKLPSGAAASARLDRWYSSADLAAWISNVEVCRPGARADHRAVRLHLVNPADPVRIRKPGRVYPPPPIAVQQVKEAMSARITAFHDHIKGTQLGAAEVATEWEQTKTAIRKEALTLIRQRRKTARATYRQKCRRLIRQEQRLLALASGAEASVGMITDLMEAMSLSEGRGDSPLTRVRNAITDCMRGRLALRQRRLFQQGQHRQGKTTKAFFRRNSNKFADGVVHRLHAADGHRDRGAHGQPDTMADAWTHIFQQHPGTEADRQRVLHWLGAPGVYAEHLKDLTQPILEVEVLAAIKTAQPGKACGPDRLGNDWYRDFAAELAPVLVVMFNLWYSAGIVPDSFLEADIFCLTKGGDAQNPLNFRPLSLMNSDYKILTRVLATRVSPKLPMIIHPNQNGFVPLRSIHATLDLFTAAQTEARRNPEFAQALALLLDFMKAYDSVDREFLYAVLLWLGFPPAFVAAMRALHTGTRVRFLANGYRSRWVLVTCGIRQGCPLAPLLFILVLEALYRRIDAHPRIHGIVLTSRAGRLPLKVGGYADDTANYVKSEQEVPVVMEVTTQFALASGLRLNQNKTMVIVLNPDRAGREVVLPEPLRLHGKEQLSRYLGIQVGSGSGTEYTWELALQQLRIRLLLAGQKTNTIDQRSMLVSAIVVPKLLYIGRHLWPSPEVVARFQKAIHNFIWHGYFLDVKGAGRAWLNATVAALPRGHGGIAEPTLMLELQAMAAATVADWAVWSTPAALVVGDVLGDDRANDGLRHLVIGPRLAPPPATRLRMESTLWLTGASICSAYGGGHFRVDKASMVHALHCLHYFHGPTEVSWKGRTGVLDMAAFQGCVKTQCIRSEEVTNGVLCVEWLPHLRLQTMRLISPEGVVINPNKRYRALCNVGRQIKDVVHWNWTPLGELKLTILTEKVDTAVRRQVGHLVKMMVLNFPQMTARSLHAGAVRYGTKEPLETPYPLRLSGELELEQLTDGREGNITEREPTASHRDLELRTQQILGERGVITYVHPHPRLARLVCLWAGKRRWSLSRKQLKCRLAAAAQQLGTSKLRLAADKWQRHSRLAAAGLAQLPWKAIRSIVGLNPWGEQVLFRLKHHALSAFNPGTAGLHCPHPDCGRLSGIDLYHIFWQCSAAARLRKVLYQRWQAAGLGRGEHAMEIFSLQLTEIPRGILQVTGEILTEGVDTMRGQIANAVERTVTQCWRLDAATYLHCVWKWHVAFFDDHEETAPEVQLATMSTRLKRNHHTIVSQALPGQDGTTRRLRTGICQLLGGTGSGAVAPGWGADTHTLVFHAGQAKTEDTVGAAGVMIATTSTVTQRFRILYMQGLQPAGTFRTGEAAAQTGLLHGLRVCHRRGWHHVHVVGDNASVMRQQRTRTAPKETAQHATYWTTRRIADAIGVTSWEMHPRERNRAARGIMTASIAKGAEESPPTQANWRRTDRAEACTEQAAGDIRYWWSRHETQGVDAPAEAAV